MNAFTNDKVVFCMKEFTNEVSSYIAKGYLFSPTMAGNQGEIMRVDLIKGNEVVRILLEHEVDEFYLPTDKFIMVVETFYVKYENYLEDLNLFDSDSIKIKEIRFN